MPLQDTAEMQDVGAQANDINFLPPWLLQYASYDLDALRTEVHERTVANRINSWDQAEMIATAVIKQVAGGGKASDVYTGWDGVGRSWAITLANLARVFPPEVRTEEMIRGHQMVWYEAIYNLAKQETSLTNTRNLSPQDWARLSGAAVTLAEKFKAHDTDSILRMIGVHKGANGKPGNQGAVMVEGQAADGRRTWEIPAYVDAHGHLHTRNSDGSMGQKTTMPELLRSAGIITTAVTVVVVQDNEAAA